MYKSTSNVSCVVIHCYLTVVFFLIFTIQNRIRMQIAEHLMHVYCDYSLKKKIVACHFHQISVTS